MTNATKRINSGFCRNSDNRRPPARNPAKNLSKAAKLASGSSARDS
jgi:hypothetical protein